MKKKLLNFSKNLIIVLGLVVVLMLFFTTRSYAASQNLAHIMRETISDWYRVVRNLSISIYSIGYLLICLHLLTNNTPEKLKIFKESLARFFIMFAVIFFLHYIMLLIITINQEGISIAKNVGIKLSGIDASTPQEYDLYETALSKAYEIAAVPGFIGLIMYFLLIFYTYKFVIFYVKRYINIIVLILISPIIFVISTIKKILIGINDGWIRKWTKEFIFNVIIQTIQAILYATFIGVVLRLSDNDETLIGALLALIIFGVILKIDTYIRKIFNAVGGSTSIRGSRALSLANSAFSKAEGAITEFGKNVKNEGFGNAVKKDFNNTKFDFKRGLNSIGQKASHVKSEFKDLNNILDGQRVKENLTGDEIIREYHNIENPEGLEKLRQGVQGKILQVEATVVGGIDKIKGIGKYSSNKLHEIYNSLDTFKKKKLSEINQEFKYMVNDITNDIEKVKRIPSILKKFKKKQKYIRTSDGINLDVANSMMLVVDTDVDPKEIIEELKKEYGEGVDASAFIFNNLGAQAFLSEEVGSSALGLSVLAEDNYEKLAEHKVDDLVGKKRPKKRKLKKATNMRSRRAVKKAAKTVKKSENTNKVYKFSRFNPDTARKITNRLLKKSREQNRYLIVLTKTYEDVQMGKLTLARRAVKSASKDINYNMKMTRKKFTKSIRKIKLSQRAAVAQYKETVRKTRRIEMANEVADRAMTAKNTIRLGFKRIDNMTPGQIGLRKMIKSGLAYQVSDDLVIVKKDNTEEKIKATGLFKPEENEVIQFVISEEGKIIPQIVTVDGKIVKPAVTEDGKVIGFLNNSLGVVPTKKKVKNLLEQFEVIAKDYVETSEKQLDKKSKVKTKNVIFENNQANEKINKLLQQIILVVQDYAVEQPKKKGKNTSPEVTEIDEKSKKLLQKFLEVAKVYMNDSSEQSESNISENVKTNKNVEMKVPEQANKKVLKLLKQLLVASENYVEQVNVEEKAQEEFDNEKGTLEEKKLRKQQKIIDLLKPKETAYSSEGAVSQVESRKAAYSSEGTVSQVESREIAYNSEEAVSQVEPIENEVKSESSLDKVVQRIINLEGNIVEQVVNSDNTVETESYNIVTNVNNETLVQQISEVITNEDLGLEEDVSAEEKVQKFENLLQDLKTQPLLEQVLQTTPEEENELDEIILSSAIEANVPKLKYLDYNDDEDAKRLAVQNMVSKGIITSEEAEDDDILGNTLDILNDRVKALASEKSDVLVDKVAEMEYIKFVEDSINLEGFNREHHPTDEQKVDIEAKTEEFSDLLMNLAKERIDQITKVPVEIIKETIDATHEVLKNAEEGIKTPEEIAREEAEKQYKKELEKAEKKWAKRNNKKAEKDIYERVKNQGKNSNEASDETVKITLKFFGNVKNQGQSVVLSNKNSIKDFYDKADKLDGSDLKKTQERFLQVYGGKLNELQLTPFSFAKCPVEVMDGWSIYVVSVKEDVTEDEKVREKIVEPIEESVEELIDRYIYDLRRTFTKFVEENEIDSFDTLHQNPTLLQTLNRKIRTILFRRGEPDSTVKSTEIVNNLHKDVRFRNVLKEVNDEISTKKFAEERVRKAKERMEIKSKEEAEKEASNRISKKEIENDKKRQKEKLAEQVFDEMTRQEEKVVMVNPDLQNLLEQLNENKVYIEVGETKSKKKDVMRFQY